MFILDSLMIAGIRWALQTTLTAAEAEMNDDTALREQLLEAEMRREMGEISDDEFRDIEADLLARIREIRERREGTAPLEIGAQPIEAPKDSTFQVEAELSGDFHEPLEPPAGSGRPARAVRSRRSERSTDSTPAARRRQPAHTSPAGPTTRTTPARRAPRASRTRRTTKA